MHISGYACTAINATIGKLHVSVSQVMSNGIPADTSVIFLDVKDEGAHTFC